MCVSEYSGIVRRRINRVPIFSDEACTMINELDKAQLRHEMRSLYKEVGMQGALECLYEILASGVILLEVIKEEYEKSKDA